jgi:hypothetical protein
MSANDVGGENETRSGGDLVLPLLAAAFTVYFFISVSEIAWEAKANAVTIGIALLVLIAVQTVRTALGSGLRTGLRPGPLLAPRALTAPRIALVATTAIFVGLIPWLGLTLGLFLLTALLMAILRAGSAVRIALTAAIVAGSAYVLFIAILNSRLPRGPVEHLLAQLLTALS